jgi:Flp pilus assembly protein TadG
VLFRRRGVERDDRGVAMVEFALVAIPLIGLLLGVIEFGWSFNQQQDVRYGAREGARVAAVSNINGTNTAPTAQQIDDVVCARMDSSSPQMHVSLVATPSVSGSTPTVGDQAVIQVTKPLQQITGFSTWMLGGDTITSKISFRLEQPVTWSNTSAITKSGSMISGGLTCST